jgi:RNA recognition motif-containing protein
LPLERDTGRKRGFAFVEMADAEMEARAIEALQGAELMGRPLRINQAEPRSNGPRRTGGNTAPAFSPDRASGARGWEDRSYGNAAADPDFEAARTRRRRSGSGGSGLDQAGAEG